MVGPQLLDRSQIRYVREDPPGGGPAAALVTGLRAALAGPATAIMVLPGDAPGAGHAATVLAERLSAPDPVQAVIAVDADGREQPLQLALRRAAAEALVRAAGPAGAAGASARALVRTLDPPAVRHRLAAEATFDIDTPAHLAAWRLRESEAVQAVLDAVGGLDRTAGSRPVVVALDGPSAAGTSTLALAIALRTPAAVLAGDDFHHPALATVDPVSRDAWTDPEVVDRVFDWRRLRTEALVPLAGGREAVYRPYDWHAGAGLAQPRRVAPQPLVVLEGVYAARRELADLVDLSVYVDTAVTQRLRRRGARADDPDLRRLWERGERYYFEQVRPRDGFDLVLGTGGVVPG